jgi:hypothetical protein
LLGKSLDVVQEEILSVKCHKVRDTIQFVTDKDIAWEVSRYSTRRHFICKKSQGKGDNSVSHLYSHQTLLGKSLDVVQEDILYVKSHKVREIIQVFTDRVIRHCLASL